MSNEREAFEAAWTRIYGGAGQFLLRHHKLIEQYANHDTQRAWEGWKAALEWQAASQSAGATGQEPAEDHECTYENGDGICRECAALAKREKAFGYARQIDYRITGQTPEDHELCHADAPGAFPLYAAPIGDNGAFVVPERRRGETFAEWAKRAYEQNASQPAESTRVELMDEEIDAVWDSVSWKDLNVSSLEHVSILRRRFARALLARASAKGA